MIITYFRSSSYNNWSMCQLQYYITYVLGYTFPSTQAADKGTIVHKALECAALITKELQDNPDSTSIEDSQLGTLNFTKEDMYKPTELSDEEVDIINKSRKAITIYKSKCTIPYGTVRLGVDLMEELFDRSYDFYVTKSTYKWGAADKRHCNNWMWMATEYKDGMYDPRKKNIKDVEPHFDIIIDKPWAKYDYLMPNGEQVSGNLAIKGTVDLITEVGDGILEIVDWKTGQRLDWSSNAKDIPKKTYEKLCSDPQLMLYYYAAKHMYPEAEHVMLSIFYVRDGGPFSMCFDDQHIADMEGLLEERFNEIKDCTQPTMVDTRQASRKCKYFCPFSKNQFSEDDDQNMCFTTNKAIKEHGLDFVTLNLTKPGHSVNNYDNPGE